MVIVSGWVSLAGLALILGILFFTKTSKNFRLSALFQLIVITPLIGRALGWW
jgi:uncharacterized membrane protein YgdD (TMEM256/DUF423 family)